MKENKTVQQQREVLAQNIQRLLDRKGITQTDMARDLGLTETTVSSWMNCKRYPRIDKIQLMADYFNVRRSDITEDKPTNLIETMGKTIRIPILGTISCGEPILAEENYEDFRTTLTDNLPAGNLFYLRAKGDSMAPTIPNESIVLVREQPDVENGEIAAVLVNGNEEATLKRVKKQNGQIVLLPDNPNHKPIFVTENQPAKIIGKALRFESNL